MKFKVLASYLIYRHRPLAILQYIPSTVEHNKNCWDIHTNITQCIPKIGDLDEKSQAISEYCYFPPQHTSCSKALAALNQLHNINILGFHFFSA